MSIVGYVNDTGILEITINSWDRNKKIKTFVVPCVPAEGISIDTNLLDSRSGVKSIWQKYGVCKCGDWIAFVGTKWQHVDEVKDPDPQMGTQLRYREKCYHCACIDPTPKKEKRIEVINMVNNKTCDKSVDKV